ncbi:HPP family protein [Parahaliea mediterranea]|uniref:HPP family protein n=1 Tax=Parahaliea mediterranea TaxID=651086 RepID=UPI00130028AB|nr:HPP family protein [Parahaliea mediterranea]
MPAPPPAPTAPDTASLPARLARETASLLGIGPGNTSHREKLLSATGAFVGILCLSLLAPRLWGDTAGVLIATSIGASTVLLFAIPHGPLSQPWPVLLGYSVSAAIGVSCARFIADPALAAACAVGGAVLAMHYLRCLHPPGGAAALAAVVGGEQVRALGYDYLLSPILYNGLLMVAVAVAFNIWFRHRRYPTHLSHLGSRSAAAPATAGTGQHITHEDMAWALQKMDLYVDVSPEDLCELFELAGDHARESAAAEVAIEPGAYYSNGLTGFQWQVLKVEEITDAGSERRGRVHFQVVHGPSLGEHSSLPLHAFRQRARVRVRWEQGHWIRDAAGQ